MKSGTSIGANIREAKYAESKNDFIHKYKISLKESNETEYWLELLFESGLLNEEAFNELHKLNTELMKLLTSSIKTLSNR
jgi:four helix bundle protein